MGLGDDTKAVLLAASVMFLWALLLGVWKYRQMAEASDGLAHPYVDTAHRAALLYSFALLLVAVFVELSGWSVLVNLLAAGAMAFYFLAPSLATCFMAGAATRPTSFTRRRPACIPSW